MTQNVQNRAQGHDALLADLCIGIGIDTPRGPFALSRTEPGAIFENVKGFWFCAIATCTACAALALGCSEEDPYTEPAPSRGPVPAETSIDYALSFDGSDDYVTTATSGFPFSEFDQSITAWVKPRDSDGQLAIVTMRRHEESGTLFGVEEGRLVAYNIYGMRAFVQSEGALTRGYWHHVAYTQQATGSSDTRTYTQRLYVDGSLVATGSLPPQNRTPIAGYIGSFDGSRSLFAGELDDLAIWSRRLSEEEIQALSSGSTTPSGDALVACWNFIEQPERAVAYDRSPFENHATLGDGADEFMPRRVVSDR
jgi:hypothetical protein